MSMWKWLGRTVLSVGLGGLLTMVGFGFGIVGLAMAVEPPTNALQALGFFGAMLLFMGAGQWLLWVRHVVPGADSVAGGLVLLAIGTVLVALSFEPHQENPWALWLMGAPFLAGGAAIFRKGARTARTGGAIGSLGRFLGFDVPRLK